MRKIQPKTKPRAFCPPFVVGHQGRQLGRGEGRGGEVDNPDCHLDAYEFIRHRS